MRRTPMTGLSLATAAALTLALPAAFPAAASAGPQASQEQPETPAKPAADKAPEAAAKAEDQAVTVQAKIGEPAPDFTLQDTEGNTFHLADYLKEGKPVVLEWFNPDCPFVQKHHKLTHNMDETYALAKENGVVWLAVNSGAKGKQGNGIERNRQAIKDYGIAYPVLMDETGEVGRLYGAKTTPDMFVINAKGVLIYSGAIDDAPNTTTLGKTNYVKDALHQMLAGKPVETSSTKSYGCSVKYAERTS